jgi:CHAT domain-containing protein
MGNNEQALVYYNQCLKLSRAAKKVRTEANALSEIATVYASLGHPDQTLKRYQKLREFYASIRDRRGEALVLNTQGDLLLSLGKKESALGMYSKALPFSEQVGDKGILISTLYNLARVQRDLGRFDDALSLMDRSLKIIEELRTNVGSLEFRASYFSAVRKHYELCIDILMLLDRERPRQGFAVKALLISEKSRARSLVDLLSESRSDSGNGPAELIKREIALRGMIRAMAQYEYDLSLRKTDSTEVGEVVKEVTRLRSEYQEIQAQIREQSPHVMSLEKSAPQTLEQIQNELKDGQTMLLEYALGDQRSYLWAVTADSFQSYELPARKILEDAAIEVYNLTTARQAIDPKINGDYRSGIEESDRLFVEKANSLSQLLLGPAATQLRNRRLLFVTEGALQYVPFEALPVPFAPNEERTESVRPALITTNEIVESPSISTLVAIRAERTPPASPDKLVAVIADPVFSRSDERLRDQGLIAAVVHASSDRNTGDSLQRGLDGKGGPSRLTHASEEADAITAVAPRGSTFVAMGFDASRETAMSSRIGEYQIVHFATHGFLDSEHPELSSIVLTMVDHNGAEKNGLMPLYDISSLNLSAELTVLSACQTGLGKDIKGEGFVGLTHSFISAGSKSVLATLWKVDDRATAALMTELYDSMLQQGLQPSVALRSAKLKIMQEKQWSAPYYWAGFVLQGEYSNRITVPRNRWVQPAVVLLLLLALISSSLLLLQRRKRLSLVEPQSKTNTR